ncbi:MAG: HAD hydrolase family protein [Sulfurimonas sp.]|uniref:KdsC family phosphatase n=1 Tax=Sulfurimonas sp. TaxID=2022749 RepID=UPI0025EAA692|nr:HAD hydrolase family protein [Sulfurimonas sp.]MCK9491751.1 HAD hydrolase family protein [Sulfurimonas sp.]
MTKLIVLDVDGCLSDGKLTYSSNGVETKSFNVKDGLAISSWIKMGNHVAIITGRKSSIVKRRAKELGIKHLYQGVKDKQKILKEVVDSLGLNLYEVAAIGDDLNDYHMLCLVGKSFTPSDGVKEIKEIVKRVLSKNGGDGVVREMIDLLVDENDQREEFMRVWI